MHSLNLLRQQRPLNIAHGFTLIELLIVVALIGVLAAVAYPQYGKIVEKSRRADAHLALLQEVQNFERCRATNFSYTSCTLAQLSSPEGFYDLTITAQGATNYTLTATATGVQASDTACNVMTINDRNVRTPTADCWPN